MKKVFAGIFFMLGILGGNNTATERNRWNARFSWEYKPLSFIYLVWNENKTTGLREDQTIGKISYLRQF